MKNLSGENKNGHSPFLFLRIDYKALKLLQMAWEIKCLDNKKYVVISEKLDAIGKMLGGWTKQAEKQNSLNKN